MMKNKTKVCITIDTEGDSANNPNSSFLGIQIVIPRFLEIFDTYGVKATFFVQEDEILQAGTRFSDLWNSIEKQGHEIGYHAHGIIRSSPEKQEAIITRGINNLRDKGLDVVSYRGGRFHMTGRLLEVLEKNGIKYDSSVVPGLREVFDDGIERCNHVGAPHEPYFPSFQDHTKAGDSTVLELPVNRYAKISRYLFLGVMQALPKDIILFDHLRESQKEDILIVLIHSWEGLSMRIRKHVRSEKSGKIKKIAWESARRFLPAKFLTNTFKLRGYEIFLQYIAEKDDVCFTTIREAGKSRADGLSE
jgi:hypothetical protein